MGHFFKGCPHLLSRVGIANLRQKEQMICYSERVREVKLGDILVILLQMLSLAAPLLPKQFLLSLCSVTLPLLPRCAAALDRKLEKPVQFNTAVICKQTLSRGCFAIRPVHRHHLSEGSLGTVTQHRPKQILLHFRLVPHARGLDASTLRVRCALGENEPRGVETDAFFLGGASGSLGPLLAAVHVLYVEDEVVVQREGLAAPRFRTREILLSRVLEHVPLQTRTFRKEDGAPSAVRVRALVPHLILDRDFLPVLVKHLHRLCAEAPLPCPRHYTPARARLPVATCGSLIHRKTLSLSRPLLLFPACWLPLPQRRVATLRICVQSCGIAFGRILSLPPSLTVSVCLHTQMRAWRGDVLPPQHPGFLAGRHESNRNLITQGLPKALAVSTQQIVI